MPDLVPARRRAQATKSPAAPASVGEALRRFTRPAGEGDGGTWSPPAPGTSTEDDAAFWSRYQRVAVRIPDPPPGGLDLYWNGRAMPTYERPESAACAAGLYVDLPAGWGALRIAARPFVTDAGSLSYPVRAGGFTVPVPAPGAVGEAACPVLLWQSEAFPTVGTEGTGDGTRTAAEALVRVLDIPLPAEVEIVGVGRVALDAARLFRSPQGAQRFILSAAGERIEVSADVGPSGVEVKWTGTQPAAPPTPPTAPPAVPGKEGGATADPTLGTIAVTGAPPGVTFIVSRSDGSEAARFVSDASGEAGGASVGASVQVPPGTYKLRAELPSSLGAVRVRSVAGETDPVRFSSLAADPLAPPVGPVGPDGSNGDAPPPAANCGPLAVVPQGLDAPGTICAGARMRDNAGREYVVVVREVDGALVAEPVQPEGSMSGVVKTLLVVAVAAGAVAAVAWYLDRYGDGGGAGGGDREARANPRARSARLARRAKRAGAR